MDNGKLLRGPAAHPPQGVTPNLNHNYGPEQFTFYICVSFCTVFSGLFMLLRAYTKFIVLKRWELDEYFLILGFLLFIALEAVGRVTLDYGMGVHQWNITLGEFFRLLYWLNIYQILYPACCVCIKTAIVLQYLRMFAPVRSLNMFMFVGGWATIALNVGFYISRMFVAIFECTPREKIWNKLYVGGSCVDDYKLHIATGFFNIFSDLVILFLPIRSLWRLQIPLRKKFGISLLFASGLLATVATALRTYYGVLAQNSGDWSYETAWDGLWAYAELSLGIIIACAITLPKLVKEKGFRFTRQFSSLSSLWKRKSSSDSSHGRADQTSSNDGERKDSGSDADKDHAAFSNNAENVLATGDDWSETIRNLA
ncbi:hypothetical protein K491DRAFT_693317 [Lophiostoma macrostomum CBS 122681]|uniref:Rhodopsin domain-containing protein n=1 Tax=Lophiostoma macrostomum CBS 122681 TaxID=1314788 RepID=A0A6A6T5I8_9PLEO|nr:hypothetical protein K491DRAFT_693317 [Lophiostoma macrostomum CBS 122681]